MYKVKVKKAVYFNDKRHEIGDVAEIEEKYLDDSLFEVIEKIEEEKTLDDSLFEVIEKIEEEKTLDDLTVPELKEIAKEKDIESYSTMKREELIDALKE